jgi:phosphohistidine phosphatase SixA
MAVQQAGGKKRDGDRRDDPGGAPRARLAARQIIRRLFRINGVICSKHVREIQTEPLLLETRPWMAEVDLQFPEHYPLRSD